MKELVSINESKHNPQLGEKGGDKKMSERCVLCKKIINPNDDFIRKFDRWGNNPDKFFHFRCLKDVEDVMLGKKPPKKWMMKK